MPVAKSGGQKALSLINSILKGLDEVYVSGAFKDSGLGLFNWVEHERQLSNTNKDAIKASYLVDVINQNFAKQDAQEQLALEKLTQKLEGIQGGVISGVPGLQEKINSLVRQLQKDRADKVLENTNRAVKRSRSEELANRYRDLSDDERARAGDETSTAGRIIKEFNKQASENGFKQVDPGNATRKERQGNKNAQAEFTSKPSYEEAIIPG